MRRQLGASSPPASVWRRLRPRHREAKPCPRHGHDGNLPRSDRDVELALAGLWIVERNKRITERDRQLAAGEQISVTMANKLADMHEIAPQLTEAVAKRITTSDLHDKALRDLGAFVHRTVVEDEHTYAVRIDDGTILDAAQQIDHARPHLNEAGRGQAAAILGCELQRLDRELDALAARAKARALKVRITTEVRDRARNGRYAYAQDRGRDFAAGIWVIDPRSRSTSFTNTSRTTIQHRPARRPTLVALGSTMTNSATPPLRTSSGGPKRERGRLKPRAATSGWGTTSEPH